MSEETRVKAPAAADELNKTQWRHYPHLDAAVEAANPYVLASIRKTQTDIDRLLRNGTEREKERARLVRLAYTRAVALYDELAELRNQSLRSSGNKPGDSSNNSNKSAITG
jgi:hypothetical protein